MPDSSSDSPLTKTWSNHWVCFNSYFFLFYEGCFFLIPHVPSDDPFDNIVASMTSFCMSGVFWLAVSMFQVTLADYKRNI